MTRNMGGLDRMIRFVVALAVAYLYYAGHIPGAVGIVLGVLAAIFLVTGFVGTCPLYSLVGLSTCKRT